MKHCTHHAQHGGATHTTRREQEGERDGDRERVMDRNTTYSILTRFSSDFSRIIWEQTG